MTLNPARQLERLEQSKHLYGKGCARKTQRLLASFRGVLPPDAKSLVRLHDTLLFLRAFPQSAQVVQLTESLLRGIGDAVQHLRDEGADLSLFDDEEFSGVVNTVIRDTPTYDVARWMSTRYARYLTVDWSIYEQARQLSSSLTSFVPFIADDCLVEADTPYLTWLADAAGGERKILSWLLEQIHQSSLTPLEKTATYDALQIEILWDLGKLPVSRTLARRNTDKLFYHREPLIQRKQVSLSDELNSGALPVRRLIRREAEEVLDMACELLEVRYRELYGTTRADRTNVIGVDVGRGVQMFLWGIPPDRRLPLRAYHAGTTLKNGVPVNYFEAISLFEWMEVGFNTFYAFREGETAWIYSKILHLLHQVTAVSCFSAYPYQLGHENEEAIRSGAFWFYRKLGFRPGRPDLLALAEREEARMQRDPAHRTSAVTLRKLAAHHAFYEFGDRPHGLWDTFSTRKIGFAVQRKMAREYHGDPRQIRQAAVEYICRILRTSMSGWLADERLAMEEVAPVLSLISDLPQWSADEKRDLIDIIRSKAARDQVKYLRRLQHHDRLRKAILRLGS